MMQVWGGGSCGFPRWVVEFDLRFEWKVMVVSPFRRGERLSGSNEEYQLQCNMQMMFMMLKQFG